MQHSQVANSADNCSQYGVIKDKHTGTAFKGRHTLPVHPATDLGTREMRKSTNSLVTTALHCGGVNTSKHIFA
jgi:hypothetical protein